MIQTTKTVTTNLYVPPGVLHINCNDMECDGLDCHDCIFYDDNFQNHFAGKVDENHEWEEGQED